MVSAPGKQVTEPHADSTARSYIWPWMYSISCNSVSTELFSVVDVMIPVIARYFAPLDSWAEIRLLHEVLDANPVQNAIRTDEEDEHVVICVSALGGG